jgi:single-strand selective monofunctional uracil DNA glycosylase
MPPSTALIASMRELARDVRPLRFAAPVTHVYNPLEYAAPMHEAYLRAYARTRKKVLFIGMNPGPFGMAQTGIPFGEIAAVRDWLKLDERIGKPEREHPRRLVHGLQCARSEVSGRRLWGLFAQRFAGAKAFFSDHFVANYCPLAFMEESGRNLTPDKLGRSERDAVYAACDKHLRRLVETLTPQWLIGVGAFAAERAEESLVDIIAGKKLRIGRIDHPSPANPNANKNWAGRVTKTLIELGVW